MALRVYDDFVSRAAAGFRLRQPIWDYTSAATGNSFTGNQNKWQRVGQTKALPSFPSGVTNYIMTQASYWGQSSGQALIAQLINLGSLTLGDGAGAASSFAAGSAMPTKTELGVASVATWANVMQEVTTPVTATPGTYTVTYTNQAGTAGQVTPAITPAASAAIHTAGWLQLASGDYGVKSISAASRSGGTNPGGVIKFWGVIPLGSIPIYSNGFSASGINVLSSMMLPVRMAAGAVIGVFVAGQSAVTGVAGSIYIIGDN